MGRSETISLYLACNSGGQRVNTATASRWIGIFQFFIEII